MEKRTIVLSSHDIYKLVLLLDGKIENIMEQGIRGVSAVEYEQVKRLKADFFSLWCSYHGVHAKSRPDDVFHFAVKRIDD